MSVALVFSFLQPLWLLLLPVCLLLVWLMPVAIPLLRKQKRKKGHTPRFMLVWRSVIVILLVLSLAGVSFRRYSKTTATIFAIDVSDSMKGTQEEVQRFLLQASEAMGKDDLAGIVSFGGYAAVEQMPSADFRVSSIGSAGAKDASDITQALKLAQAILPQDSKKKVIIISDGRENSGDALTYARQLREQGVVTDVVWIGEPQKDEAQITSVTVPKSVAKNTKYDVEIKIQSTSENSGRLLLYKNDRLIADWEVKLRPGENSYRHTELSDEGGGARYRAELRPVADTFHENNTAYAYGYVEDAPKLLLADYQGSSAELARLLKNTKVSVVTVDSQALPTDPAEINQYDGILLPDIPIDGMPDAFPEIVESFVKNAGGGVVVTGGENTYGPGGYHGTPFEQLLPVDMNMKDEQDMPVLAMVLVLDRSGSMSGGNYGISKLSLAKEAAIRSVESLMDGDFFGVLAFDDGYEWASPLQLVQNNREAMINNIASISEGGGTSILPALQEAYGVLSKTEAKTKHIILLTDGQAEQTGYDLLLSQMNQEAITLSAIAVGSDADVTLLRYLAEEGKGRYYFSNEFTDLPKIFTKETQLAGKAYLKHVDFYPSAKDASPILSGIDTLPVLHGYVATTAKPRADRVLVSHEDEPVLAAWQYGLGRAVAWCSDASGQWSADFLASEQGTEVFRNMVSYVIRKQMTGAIDVAVKAQGKGHEITVSIPYSEGVRGVGGGLLAQDGSEIDVAWESTAPGVYQARLQERNEGTYIVNLTIDKLSGEELFSTGIAIGYPAEYDISVQSDGESFLKKLAESGGGHVLHSPEQSFDPVEESAYQDRQLSDSLLWLALVLFIVEVALKRFPSVLEKGNQALEHPLIFYKRKKQETDIIMSEPKKDQSKSADMKQDAKDRQTAGKANTSSMLVDRKKRRTGR